MICPYCKNEFEPRRPTQKWCSLVCRQARRNKGTRQINSKTAEMMSHLRDDGWSWVKIGDFYNRSATSARKTVLRWRKHREGNQNKQATSPALFN